jgi:putative salt-induced outer membrane protein YdiY
MKQILALFLLLFATTAQASTKLSIGGMVVNDEDITFTVAGEHTYEKNEVQWIADADYSLKIRDGDVFLNRGYIGGKVNYTFDPKQYVFVDTRYDYNQFRVTPSELIGAVGYGYKLVRTDKTKISNEMSVGLLRDSTQTSPVIRNSIWVSHKFAPKTNFTNKLLVEYTTTKQMFVRNQTEVNYEVTKNLTFGLKNMYVSDPVRNNIGSFNLGVKF